ncbi:hypothetical protein BH11ARM2_BH11ARM2_35020 [soil metagenome]
MALLLALFVFAGLMLVVGKRQFGRLDPMFAIAGEGCQMVEGGHVAKRNSSGGLPGAALMDMEINRCPESFEAAVKRIRPQLKGWTERSIGRGRPTIVFIRSATPGGPRMGAAGMDNDSVSIDVWPPGSSGTRVTATQRMRNVPAPASLFWLWVARPEFLEPKQEEPTE